MNVVSMSAFQPVPFLAVYAATKAFVLSLTEALAVELEGRGGGPGPVSGQHPDRVPAGGGHGRGGVSGTPAMSAAEVVVGASLRALDARRSP